MMTLARATTALAAILALLLAGAALAQPVPPAGSQDPFAGKLFAPELILKNQARLSLGKDQREAIMAQMKAFQSEIVSLQWDLQEAMEALQSELDAEPIAEERTLALLGKVLELESNVKRAHMRLVIRIRNSLDAEQVATLREIAGSNRR